MRVYQTNLTICSNYKQYWSYKTQFIHFTSLKQKKEKQYTSEYSRSKKSYSYYQENACVDLTHKEIALLNKITKNFIDYELNVKVKDMVNFLINLQNLEFEKSKRVPKNVKTIRLKNKHVNIYIDLKKKKYFLENK